MQLILNYIIYYFDSLECEIFSSFRLLILISEDQLLIFLAKNIDKKFISS